MSDFTQTAPKARTRFRHDMNVRYALERHLPATMVADAAERMRPATRPVMRGAGVSTAAA